MTQKKIKKSNNFYYFELLFFFLILLTIFFFFYGFIVGENSAGSGGYKGDFDNVWKTLQTFLNNDIKESIKSSSATSYLPEQPYISSRTPLIYMLNELFNPFTNSKVNFIRSIFFFSLLTPILFYYSLKIKYPKINKSILILLACTILLSPYFRTSSYWALEENYGIIFIFISFILLEIFFKEKNKILNKYIKLFFLTFASSLCVYFDQKLLIIPLMCFIKIIFSDVNKILKISTFLMYIIFSLPFLYLIFLWGNILPTTVVGIRNTGEFFHLSHVGFTLTIIGFYFIPLFFFKDSNILHNVKFYLKNKNNSLLLLIFLIYLFFSYFFDDYQNSSYPNLGKGVIHKLSLLLFDNLFIQKLFIYFNFVIFYFIVVLFLNRKFSENLVILYFIISSIFIFPILQEYYDPLIFILVFIFFDSRLKINYKNVLFLFFYLAFFLIYAKFHYSKI